MSSDGERAGIELSLAMIVRDEAADIGECLAAAAPHVDEIVVLDTGSSDETIAIAERAGARVHRGTWHDDFARARNEVLSHCSGRWILSLDADERIDPVNAHRLRRALRYCDRVEEGRDVLALAITIESTVGPPGAGMRTRHVFPRVFRKDPFVAWYGALHEQLVHRTKNLLEHTRLTDVAIEHLGYGRERANEGRRARNARILDGAVAGSSRFDRLSAAHTAISYGRHAEALPVLRELIDQDLPSNLDATARWSLATSLAAIGKREDARHELEAAIIRYPDHQSFRYVLGVMHLEEGRFVLARDHFDTLLGMPAHAPSDRTDVVPTRRTIAVQRARTFLGTGDPAEALRLVDEVLAREPSHPEARFQRGVCLEALGRIEEALSVFEALSDVLPDEPAVRTRIGRCRDALASRSRPTGPGDRAPGLALAVIARDEATNLAELLPSMKGLCEEIVVVDTGSTDATREVARAHGARLVREAWSDDFSAARNAGLAAVTSRWVLWLDADERLPRRSWPLVRRLVDGELADAAAVRIESTHQGHDPVAASSGTYCRLFRADLGARFEGRVHEQILPSLERAGARVVETDIVIEHHGYALDVESMERKKRRNLRLLELQAAESPDDYYVHFQLGTTEVALGHHERALAHFLDAERTMPPNAPIEIRLWTELRLAQASFVLGRLDEAGSHASAALRLRPGLELGNYLLAALWSARGRPRRALACLRRILDRDEPDTIAPMRRDVVESDARRLREALERARVAA